jgi:hypothetical protein
MAFSPWCWGRVLSEKAGGFESAMRILNDEAALQALVDDRESEGITLEFKSAKLVEKDESPAIKDLSCEISAFANSAGGTLIIGIEESQQADSGCVAECLKGISKDRNWKAGRWRSEWLASKLEEKIEPKIVGLEISEVVLADDSWCLVVRVPPSVRAPHQAVDKKYYARRQFQKMPMAHYEIEDVRNRQRVRRSDIRFALIIDRGVFVELAIENNGDRPVFDLRFVFPAETLGVFRLEAPALKDGITALNPGDRLSFYIGGLMELFKHKVLKNDTRIELHYKEESGSEEERFIIFNLNNYDHSSRQETEIARMSGALVAQGKRMESQLEKIGNGIVESLGLLCNGSGLTISHDTLARLGAPQLASIKWNPRHLNRLGIQEVLECSEEEAIILSRYFHLIGHGSKELASIEGVSEELLVRVRARLKLSEKDAG